MLKLTLASVLAANLLLTVGLLLDASFRYSIESFLFAIKVRMQHGLGEQKSTMFDARMCGAIVAMLVTLIGSGFLVYETFANPSILSIAGTSIAVIFIVCLFLTWKQLDWIGLWFRLKIRSSFLQMALEEINACWPEIDSALRKLDLTIDTSVLRNDSFPCDAVAIIHDSKRSTFVDGLGPFVLRSNCSITVDLLTKHEWNITYCNNDKAPDSFRISFDGFVVAYSVVAIYSLNSGLFLVQYERERCDSPRPADSGLMLSSS